jgi:hypothetical protein
MAAEHNRMANRIQLRRDTTANWANVNPILSDGEMGYDINTNEIRIGDGSTDWTGLSGNTISGGGGASTGDVTFNSINIIGNDNLRFQPNATVTDGYVDIYLTVGPDIHIDSSGGNLILGPDNWANVRLATEGNVQIRAQDGNFTSTWTFNPDGNLTIPGNLLGAFAVSPAPFISGFGSADFSGNVTVGNLLLASGGEITTAAGVGNVVIEANDGVSRTWTFSSNAALIFPDGDVQSTAYSGGTGHMFMIDTNRTDTYTEVGSSDKPFKTFAAAITAADAIDTTVTFVLMGCTVTEDVDFGGTSFTSITVATTCRSVISGNVTIDDNSVMSQMVFRNIEVGGTFNIVGDATSEQFNSVNFYNMSFSGAVNIIATNATAFYEVSFFGAVNFTNISYLYINGAQFNEDLTITADDTATYPIPSRGITPGSGGSISIVFGTIANDVNFVKGGTAAYVFQPHMTRMGRSGQTYTVPASWTMNPHSSVLRGTWVNNGTTTMRNSSSDLAITGAARAYTGIIGGDRVVADLVPANSTGAAGDAAGSIAVGGGYLYVCTANWASPGTANIWTRTLLTTGAW